MFLRNLISLILIGLVLNLGLLPTKVFAINNEEKLDVKIKEGVRKLGTGIDAKVKVKLKDNTKIKGYISEITDNGFTVVSENNTSTEILYPQVKQVKGNNLSTGAKVIIGIGVLLGIILVITLLTKDTV
jgi:hypothetical protein